MDDVTQSAFKELWSLWVNSQEIGDSTAAWNRTLKAAEEICEKSNGAVDPKFIKAFACDVLESLDRINAH